MSIVKVGRAKLYPVYPSPIPRLFVLLHPKNTKETLIKIFSMYKRFFGRFIKFELWKLTSL